MPTIGKSCRLSFREHTAVLPACLLNLAHILPKSCTQIIPVHKPFFAAFICYDAPMTIIISHTSALRLLRLPSIDGSVLTAQMSPSAASNALDRTQPCADEISEFLARHHFPNGEKLHILIPREDARTRSALATCHVEPAALPKGALIRLSDGNCACTPAFTFQQLAAKLPLAQAVALGFELSSSYRLSPDHEKSFQARPALAAPSQLRQFAEAHHAHRGAPKGSIAARYVLGDSASPMETITAIPLVLPCRYGGYGLPAPHMNHTIQLPESAQRTCGKRYLVADLFWPEQQLCVEYNSTQFHTGSEKIDSDARRQTALLDAGIQVIEVTAAQALSADGMDAIAITLAKKMGRRIRPVKSWRDAQSRMRHDLLSWHGLH